MKKKLKEFFDAHRKKQVALFTVVWICYIFVGICYYSAPRYNLELGYWWVYGKFGYFLALPIYLLLDGIGTQVKNKKYRRVYFSVVWLGIFFSYPVLGRLLFTIMRII